jgi:shikimate kinase
VAKPTIVFLIGFSGCGKSTIGPQLARRLKARFYDTDAMIEQQTARKIAEIFRDDGEAWFRERELEIIGRLVCGSQRKLIALGGGAFGSRTNRALIKKSGVVVYLSCPVRELYRRLRHLSDRPLLDGRPSAGETTRQAKLRRIANLLENRKDAYRQAHLRVSTADKTVAECVAQVYRKVKQQYA